MTLFVETCIHLYCLYTHLQRDSSFHFNLVDCDRFSGRFNSKVSFESSDVSPGSAKRSSKQLKLSLPKKGEPWLPFLERPGNVYIVLDKQLIFLKR